MRIFGFLAAILLALVLAIPVFASQPEAPNYLITMSMTGKPVTIDHARHVGRDCADCHHLVGGNPNYLPCSTDGCHDVFDRRDKTAHSYYRVIHERRGVQYNSCLSCHYDVVADNSGLSKAMTDCSRSSCHP